MLRKYGFALGAALGAAVYPVSKGITIFIEITNLERPTFSEKHSIYFASVKFVNKNS